MHQAAANIEEIFFAALELEGPDARSVFLDQACGDRAEATRRATPRPRAQATGYRVPAQHRRSRSNRRASRRFGTVIGPYKLREQIGEGGMGVVYVAEQTSRAPQVALKIIKPGMDTSG